MTKSSVVDCYYRQSVLICFVGLCDSLELPPIEKAKISCAKKLFNEISTAGVKYHDVDSYQSLLTVNETL